MLWPFQINFFFRKRNTTTTRYDYIYIPLEIVNIIAIYHYDQREKLLKSTKSTCFIYAACVAHICEKQVVKYRRYIWNILNVERPCVFKFRYRKFLKVKNTYFVAISINFQLIYHLKWVSDANFEVHVPDFYVSKLE